MPGPISGPTSDPGVPASARFAPSVYALRLHAAGGGMEAWLDHAARLGFDHILLPMPFPALRDDPAPLVLRHDALIPGLTAGGDAAQPAATALAAFAAACRARGLAVLLDVVVDRIAASGPLAAEAAEVFAAPDLRDLPDPRGRVASPEAALARAADPQGAERLASWWGARLTGWQAAGVAGFRLLGLRRLPAAVAPALVAGLRRACPGAALLGWTPGMDWAALAGLEGAGLDFVSPSLPWWDWQGDWLWRELEALRRVAPLLASPEAENGPPLAHGMHDPVLLERRVRRAVLFSAFLGAGWMLRMGLEYGSSAGSLDGPATPELVRAASAFDLSAEIAAANAARAAEPALRRAELPRLLTGPGAPVLALLRADAPDPRRASRAALILANADLAHRRKAPLPGILAASGGRFSTFRPLLRPDAPPLEPDADLALSPAGLVLAAAAALPAPAQTAAPRPEDAERAARAPRIGIEDVTPRVDGGPFAVKRILGELVVVEADVICDGHDKLGVALRWRGPDAGQAEDGNAWQETRMRPLGNDRWQASFPLRRLGVHEFAVQGWRDAFASFRDELGKKHAAGMNTALEIEEGRDLVARAAEAGDGAVAALRRALDEAGEDKRRQILLSDDTAALMARADDHPFAVATEPFRVRAERTGARYASWYEVFPRSMSDDPHRHGNFDDVIRHLPRVRDMGFDVLYFPPVSPIGRTNRKGRNNALRAGPDDPGSPYAIGGEEGGHDALHPELGTAEDFRRLVEAAAAHDIEIAIDFAIQCSPDHPWLKQHKGWFDWRPDGSLRYAENPPKKYEDIVNVDFYAPDAIPDLWIALCEVVLFWAAQGVRLFRVDNPHTKPLPFWEWMIATVQARHPDAIFLAEAFTRPKVMYRLAKVGFSQSYTYFTWRNTKREMQEYLTELTTGPAREFFRPHFFVNTPDINPLFLQTAGRGGFLIRAALAATLSGLWGVYNGFELCEATPLPGREEYMDSEKYQIRAWDWNRPGNIVAEIAQLNRIRAANPALQTHLGLEFHNAANDAILWYEKATPDRGNVVLVAVSFDPHNAQETDVEVPLWNWKLPDSGSIEAEDLIGGGRSAWTGKFRRLRLTPDRPYAIFRARPLG